MVTPHMGAFHCHFRRYRQRVCATTPLSTQMYSLPFSLPPPPFLPTGGGGAFLPWCFQLGATVDRFAMQRYQLVSDSSQFIQGSWKWLLLIYRLLGRCESDTRRRGQIRGWGGGWGGALRSVGMLPLYHSPTGFGAAVSSPCSNAVKPPRDEKREMQKKEMSENFWGGGGGKGGVNPSSQMYWISTAACFLCKSHICVIHDFKKRRMIN